MLNPKLKLSNKIFKKDIDLASTRDGFGEGLLEAGDKDERVFCLTADLGESLRVTAFKDRFPERFIEVGVSEQALVTIASGMANYGKIPFVTSFAVFSPGRNWEQIRTTICLNNVPVKIIGGHTGVTVGEDGATHQMLEDIALMRALPNMVVIAPSDALETKKATLEAAKNNKPTYIRLTREKSPVFTTDKTPFKIGKANFFWEDKDPKVAMIACGPLLYEAIKAAKELAKLKIGSLVINCHTVKPIDKQAIVHAAKISGAVVTVEEHQVAGGLGSAVSEVLSHAFPVPIEFIGIHDSFGESGKAKELLQKYKMTKADILSAAKKVIRRKNS
jgi:transketolase